MDAFSQILENPICMYYYLCENRLENFDNSLNSQMEIIGDRNLNEMFSQIITLKINSLIHFKIESMIETEAWSTHLLKKSKQINIH